MKVISLKTKGEWKDKRKIGGTDLCAIVNGKGRWNTIIDVYNRLVENKQPKEQGNEKTKRGTLAENHIRQLFLLQHNELDAIYNSSNIILCISDLNDYITLSPDTLVYNKFTQENGFIEIKYKEISNENKIGDYLLNLKEREPQYYWQLIHYFLVDEKATFGYLTVAFVIKKQGKYDKTIIDSLKIEREFVKEDIAIATTKTLDFILNNVDKKVKPFLEKGDLEIWQTFMN